MNFDNGTTFWNNKTTTITVEVPNQQPSASFSVSPTTPVAGEQVTLDASASSDGDGSITKYEWDVDGDGNYEKSTSSATTTTTYDTAGSRTITLRVTDNESATNTTSKSITVDPPSLTLAGGFIDPSTVNESAKVTHTVSAVFGNLSRDGNTDRFYFEFPDEVRGSNLSASGEFIKNITSGKEVSDSSSITLVDGPDNDSIKDTLTFAVSPDATGYIDVRANATVDITWPAVNSNTTFSIRAGANDSSTGNVSLTDIATVTVVSENEAPSASFTVTPSTLNVSETVTLDASSSSDPDGSITSYEWDLDGDGNYDDATGQTNSTSFSSAGPVTISLRVTDNESATNTSSQTIIVNGPPTAAATASTSTPNVSETVTFNASGSSDPNGDTLTYEWDLNNDSSYGDATGVEATKTFSTPGEKTVGVRVTDPKGLSDTTTVTVTVNGFPTANFTISPTQPDVSESVTLDASSSSDPDGDTLTYAWDLDGDGSYDDATRATNTTSFSSAGTKTIGLKVTDTNGASNTTSTTITVNALPTPSFTVSPTHPDVGETVTLDASGSGDSDGSIASYEWDLDGDGSYDDATAATNTTSFSSAGTKTLGLRVTDDDGATNTTNVTITVNAPPTANFTVSPTEPAVDDTVTFNASTSTDSDGSIASYEWDLDGDGSYDDATGVTANTSYGSSGNVTVGLRVVDDDGAADTAAREVTVLEGPETVSSPGFGVAAAVVALIALALFARRRR